MQLHISRNVKDAHKVKTTSNLKEKYRKIRSFGHPEASALPKSEATSQEREIFNAEENTAIKGLFEEKYYKEKGGMRCCQKQMVFCFNKLGFLKKLRNVVKKYRKYIEQNQRNSHEDGVIHEKESGNEVLPEANGLASK